MRKRQRKKNSKKYLPIIVDEFPLLLMTDEERLDAQRQYEAYRQRYAFRKRYKDLKNNRMLRVYYPSSKSFQQSMNRFNRLMREVIGAL
ncbi:hypothetical protein [Paenibacillus periandrae]|uniref:hypothetical protein n=1 Tax=Paenibacillus periandrae TaxID=1761741 RepID=UPI001F09E5D9|nr:hypothetical protein [Paenibacillus periandrae]